MTPTQIPPGGDGEWARKTLFQKWFYLLMVTVSENWYIKKFLVLIQAETKILQLWKYFEFFGEKGDPWGDLNAPEDTSDRRFLYFLLDLIKYSEHVRIKNAQNHFKSTFGSSYLISQKLKLKLAKHVEKEPRKASFPWDLGLLFVQPIKYALILQNIKFYWTAKETTLIESYKFSLKMLATTW